MRLLISLACVLVVLTPFVHCMVLDNSRISNKLYRKSRTSPESKSDLAYEKPKPKTPTRREYHADDGKDFNRKILEQRRTPTKDTFADAFKRRTPTKNAFPDVRRRTPTKSDWYSPRWLQARRTPTRGLASRSTCPCSGCEPVRCLHPVVDDNAVCRTSCPDGRSSCIYEMGLTRWMDSLIHCISFPYIYLS